MRRRSYRFRGRRPIVRRRGRAGRRSYRRR